MTPRQLAIIAALAAAVGAGAYVSLRHSRDTPPPPVATQTDHAAAPAKLAATLPNFTLADRDGKQRSLADWPNRSLIVNFWATWCGPCRKEIPLLKTLQRDHAGEGFQVIGVAVDFRDAVLEYARQMQIDYPLLIGEQEALDAASSFGIEAFGLPFTVFSDAQGRVVAAHMGELTAEEADLILGAIRQVNSGTQTLEQARATIEAGLAAIKARSGPAAAA